MIRQKLFLLMYSLKISVLLKLPENLRFVNNVLLKLSPKN